MSATTTRASKHNDAKKADKKASQRASSSSSRRRSKQERLRRLSRQIEDELVQEVEESFEEGNVPADGLIKALTRMSLLEEDLLQLTSCESPRSKADSSTRGSSRRRLRKGGAKGDEKKGSKLKYEVDPENEDEEEFEDVENKRPVVNGAEKTRGRRLRKNAEMR
jgi:hypothetical protein